MSKTGLLKHSPGAGTLSSGIHSIKYIIILTWLLLLVMSGAGWYIWSASMAKGILAGGVIANIGFVWLKRDIVVVLSGPPDKAKMIFFIKYYARLSVLALVLFFLIKGRMVHLVGFLIGLSTVVISILTAVVQEAGKIYFREAS